MPIVTLVYDGAVVSETDLKVLASAVQDFVATSTRNTDVSLYAHKADVNVHVPPVHIFVQMDAASIENMDGLMNSIKEKITSWKQAASFPHTISLTIEPKTWVQEKGI